MLSPAVRATTARDMQDTPSAACQACLTRPGPRRPHRVRHRTERICVGTRVAPIGRSPGEASRPRCKSQGGDSTMRLLHGHRDRLACADAATIRPSRPWAPDKRGSARLARPLAIPAGRGAGATTIARTTRAVGVRSEKQRASRPVDGRVFSGGLRQRGCDRV